MSPFSLPKSDDDEEELSNKRLSEQLECLVRCFICYQRVKNPHECPKCSQMACLSCYKEWIYRNKKCPTCRVELGEHQLKKCRRVEQLLEQIEIDWGNLQESTENKDNKKVKKEKSSHEKGDICAEHQLKMIYFCKACNKTLCSDCILFSPDDHMTHRDQIKKIEEILDIKMEELNEHVSQLTKTTRSIRKMRINMDAHAENLLKFKSIQIHKLKEFYKTTRASIEEKYKHLQDHIDKDKTNIRNEEEQMTRMRDKLLTLQKSIKRKTKRDPHLKRLSGNKSPIEVVEEYIDKVKEMNQVDYEDTFKRIQEKLDDQMDTMNHQRMTGNEIEPPYVTYAYTLPNYKEIRTKREIIYSPEFRLRTLKWRLKIYPNGTDANLDQFLSVFLELQSGLPDDLEEGNVFQYRISMKHPSTQTADIHREFASTFKNEECWGYNRFHGIPQILQDGYLDDEGSLHFEFSLRHPTYEQTVTDMQQYIDELEEFVELHQVDGSSSKLYEKFFASSSSTDQPVAEQNSENHSIPLALENDKKVNDQMTPKSDLELPSVVLSDVEISGEVEEEEGEDRGEEATSLDLLDSLMHRNKYNDLDISSAFELLDGDDHVPHHAVSLVSSEEQDINSSLEFNQMVNDAHKIIFDNHLDLHPTDHQEDEEDTDEESETEESLEPFIFHRVDASSTLQNEGDS
mmetsp:Transcript_8697/g.12858  ORF Transcript_8697/g.12858 Transcript_8697/m.12858 type:complete len:684 (+) Transcript_8697:31-2082(+)